jgi:hypothetical protein
VYCHVPFQEHQLSCCIVSKTRGQSGEGGDGDGHRSLYAVSPQLGILRFDLSTRQQSVYAPPPAGGWNVANDLAFDKKVSPGLKDLKQDVTSLLHTVLLFRKQVRYLLQTVLNQALILNLADDLAQTSM